MSTATLDVVIEKCGYCDRDLQIPSQEHEQIMAARAAKQTRQTFDHSPFCRDYSGFHVSQEGYFYCNREHFDLFCED